MSRRHIVEFFGALNEVIQNMSLTCIDCVFNLSFVNAGLSYVLWLLLDSHHNLLFLFSFCSRLLLFCVRLRDEYLFFALLI